MQRANFNLKNKHKYQLTLLTATPNFNIFKKNFQGHAIIKVKAKKRSDFEILKTLLVLKIERLAFLILH